MTYHIKNSRGTILTTIEDRAVDLTSTSLVLHGRGKSPYGTSRNENLVHLLENFSAGSPPSNPIDGQLWWDTTDLRVWDTAGSPDSWELVFPATTGMGFSVGAGDGLTGGPVDGFPSGSPDPSVTLNIGLGTGIRLPPAEPPPGESYLSILNGPMSSGNHSFATMQITYDQNDPNADLVTKPSETAGPSFHYPLMPRWTNRGSPSSVSTIGGKHYYEIEIRDIDTPSDHSAGPYLCFGLLETFFQSDQISSARLTRQVHLDGFAPKNPPLLGIPSGSRICDGAGTFDLGGGATEQDGFAVVGSPPVIPPLAINDVVQVAVDYDNEKVWFGINDIWVGSGTQDPATNQGGYWPTDFSNVAFADVTPKPHLGPFMWMFTDTSPGSPRINKDDILAWRFSQGFWDFAAPSGFTEWPDVISERNMPDANTFQWKATPAFGSPDPVGGMFLSTFGNRAVCGITTLAAAQLAYYNHSRLAADGGKFYAESKCLHAGGLDVAFIVANAGSPIDLTGVASNQAGCIGINSSGEAKRDGSVLIGGRYDGSLWDFAPTDDGRSLGRIEAGDTYMLAIDFDNNRFYMGLNGEWFLDEDPSGSTGSPQGGLAINELGSPGVKAYVLAGSVGQTNLLNAGGVEFDYTIPTGYVAWGTNPFGSPLAGGSPSVIATDDSEIDHDALLNFVANEHIDHSSVSLLAGAGLTGGGDLIGTAIGGDWGVILNVGAGDGIDVSNPTADSVNVDQTVVILGSGVTGTSAAVPAFGFQVDNTGIYRSGTNQLSFSTNSTQRFRIESNGVLRSLNSSYESLVTNDDVIPNKKYVDNVVSGGGFPTVNTFIGTSSISGLDGSKTYLVHGYSIIPHKRVSWSFNCILDAVKLRRGTTTPGAGTIVASTPSQLMGNHPSLPGPLDAWDGEFQSEASFICPMSGDTEINMEFNTTCSGPSGTDCHLGTAYFQRYAIHMTAVQLN
ncbi:hypothetical protein LCGC14_1033950 [marine sediment metagenome]|uniref:B30.2/SPRY domain-containing protein n=1 Tax=marine sediment metagenome TaxID=412755 RepID=A0A0F9QZS0_9ZZZZ